MHRVIYAWNYIEWGGAQIHFLALIREARKEFETIVVLPEGSDDQFLGFFDSEGVNYVQFHGSVDLKPRSGVFGKLGRHWTRMKSEYAMLRKIESVGIENAIVHTDLLPAQSLLALVWLSMRAPVFITLHNALPKVPKWRWMLWKVKFGIISEFENFHIFCTNKHAARYFGRLFSRRVADDIKITYDSMNPVEMDDARSAPFERKQLLQKHGIPTDKFIVLAVGQFVDRKGRWVFLDAAAKVARTTNDIVFVWVSPIMPDNRDGERILSYILGENFHLVRSDKIGKDRQDILRFFRIADVFALPSYVEGIPIALLEIMALEVPAISTNVYGIPEAIIDGETGMLIEAGDSDGLAESILRLYSDEALRSQLAERGRKYVIENFDERIAAKTAVQAYKAAFALER